jgi:hypothetical protein
VDFSFLLLRRSSSVAMEGGDDGGGNGAKPSEGPLVEPIEFFNPRDSVDFILRDIFHGGVA